MHLDPVAVRAAWAKADAQHQEAVLAALSQLGKPYRHATSDPNVGFDCSGLTAYAWGRAGLEIPHQSGSQISAAGRRDASTAVAGDIVQYPGHVSLWLGVGDAIVHASNPENDVELSFNSRSVRYGDPHGLTGSLRCRRCALARRRAAAVARFGPGPQRAWTGHCPSARLADGRRQRAASQPRNESSRGRAIRRGSGPRCA